MRFTLGKEEKLKSKKLIEQLFSEGNRVKLFPFQMIFLKAEHEADFPIKVGFSVPKRSIKLAVDRIKIKRLMREVYRINKSHLFGNLETQYLIMFIYTGKEEINYGDMELYINKLCVKFLSNIQNEY